MPRFMWRNLRLSLYLMTGLALLCLLALAPAAWATPEQTRYGQGMTVPTVTPRVTRTATPVPGPSEPGTPVPPPVGPQPTALPPVGPGPLPTGQPGVPAGLALSMQVSQEYAWPGVTLYFTLTLSNQGNTLLQQIQVEDALPDGLDPLPSAGGGAWSGRTFQASVGALRPGERLTLTFSATVTGGPKAVLENRALARAASGETASARVRVALPPGELPATGGGLRPPLSR